jgi:hypothetical protein
MALQRLTIAKLGGVAADRTAACFEYWSNQRTSESRTDWDSTQWSAAVRASADDWFDALRDHGHCMPVLFFAEYVDSWSFSPPARFIGEVDPRMSAVYADRYAGFCTPLPLTAETATLLEKTRRHGQWPEDRLFAELTLRASKSWEALVDHAVLVFLREVLGGSLTDDEVVESLSIQPEWIPSADQLKAQ